MRNDAVATLRAAQQPRRSSSGIVQGEQSLTRKRHHCNSLAEKEGFEPSIRCNRIPDFESGAFDHSATSPGVSAHATPNVAAVVSPLRAKTAILDHHGPITSAPPR